MAVFAINPSTGAITITDNTGLSAGQIYDIVVRVTDANNQTDDGTITVELTGLSPSQSFSPSASPSPSPSYSLSQSISASLSPSQSPSLSFSISLSPSISASSSPSPSLSQSFSPSPSQSISPSQSPSPSAYPSPSPSPSQSFSPSPSPSPSPSIEPELVTRPASIAIANRLQVSGQNTIIVPGNEPTSALTSPTMLAGMRRRRITVSVAEALAAIPGSRIEYQVNAGYRGGFRQKWFVLPEVPVDCPPDERVDYYAILANLPRVVSTTEDMSGCSIIDQGFCRDRTEDAPTNPYKNEGETAYPASYIINPATMPPRTP